MKNKETIRELYNSIQEKFSREIIKQDEYIKLSEKSYGIINELKKTISEDEYEKLDNFIDNYTQQMVFEIEEYFVKGFSMANKLRDESLDR